MTTNLQDVELQQNVGGLLWCLSSHEDNKLTIAIQLLTNIKSSLESHITDGEVQQNFCGTLLNLRYPLPFISLQLLLLVPLSMSSIDRYSSNVYSSSSGSNEIKEAVIRLLETIRESMSKNLDNSLVQQIACGILFNLTSEMKNREVIIKAGFLTEIKKTMLAHKEGRRLSSAFSFPLPSHSRIFFFLSSPS
jgi:hypothetical protein